jgi:ribosomal protein S18 acetylase RimI-like enzyme
MEFRIRKAVPDDVTEIMQIMDEAKNDSTHPDWFVPDDEAYIRAHLSGAGFIIVAETQAGELAGFFVVKVPQPQENLGNYLGFDKEQLDRVLIMDSAAVAAAYRGNRLQQKMLLAAEQIIDRSRFSYLMCTIHPKNRYSLENMQANGYEIMTTVKCYGGLDRHILLSYIQ